MTDLQEQRTKMQSDMTLQNNGRLSQRFEKLLDTACKKQFDKAELLFSSLRPYLKRSSLEKMVFEISSGMSHISKHDEFYLFNGYHGDLEAILSHIRKTIAFTNELVGENKAPTLIFKLSEASVGLSYSIASIDGLGFVHLDIDNLDENVGYSGKSKWATLAHEIAHCYLYSGNRFLDEGWAVYIESLYQGKNIQEALQYIKYQSDLPGIRQLLSTNYSDDHSFEKSFPVNPWCVYLKGLAFIHYIVEKKGINTLRRIFEHPLINQPSATPCQICERSLEESLDVFEAQCHFKEQITHKQIHPSVHTHPNTLEAFLKKVKDSFTKEKLEDTQDLYLKYLEIKTAGIGDDPAFLAAEIQVQLLVIICFKSGKHVIKNENGQLVPVEELVSYALSGILAYTNQYPDTRESALFTLNCDLLKYYQLPGGSFGMSHRMLLSKMSGNIKRFRTRFPDDLPIAIFEGKFLIRQPEQYGGGKTKAQAVIKSVDLQNPEDLELIKYWLKKFESHGKDLPAQESANNTSGISTSKAGKAGDAATWKEENASETISIADESKGASNKNKLIEISRLQLTRSQFFSLDIQGLDIYEGESISIIGPNGSGKSSLIEVLAGLLFSADTQFSIMGEDSQRFFHNAKGKRRIGVQLQSTAFNRMLKVKEISALYEKAYKQVDQDIQSQFAIRELEQLYYKDLSVGQKQRVDLFLAMAHSPQLLILDEPTAGLDAFQTEIFYNILDSLKKNKPEMTLLCVSHDARDLDFSSKCLWLNAGKLQEFADTKSCIESSLGDYHVSFQSSESNKSAILNELSTFNNIKQLQHQNSRSTIGLYTMKSMQNDVLKLLNKYQIEDFRFSTVTTDDFLRFTNTV